MNDIARFGNFALRYKTYIDNRIVTSHDLEIVKYKKVDKSRYSVPASAPDEYCFQIISFEIDDDCVELTSCGLRLIDELDEAEDIDAVQQIVRLSRIAQLIFEEDAYPVQIDHSPMRSWTYNSSTGLLDEND